MVQRLAHASKDVDASTGDLDRHVAHGQKAVQDTLCNKSATFLERLQTVYRRRLQPFLSLWMKLLTI